MLAPVKANEPKVTVSYSLSKMFLPHKRNPTSRSLANTRFSSTLPSTSTFEPIVRLSRTLLEVSMLLWYETLVWKPNSHASDSARS